MSDKEIIEWLKNTSLDELVQNIFSYIKKIEADRNKLINYIAVREDKTYEDILKEFDI